MLRYLLGALVMAGAVLFSAEAEGSSQAYTGRYLWSTYLGGNGEDVAWDVAQGPGGEVFLLGSLGSLTGVSLPANTVRVGPGGQMDVAVVKFSAEGAAEWAVVFGGSAYDVGRALVLGPQGEVFVTGATASWDFSVSLPDGGPGTTLHGEMDAFVARVKPDGTGLDWFVHLGGTHRDLAYDMVLEGDSLLIAGETSSSDMPGGGGPAVNTDGFVMRFEPGTLQVQWTELLTGSVFESVASLTTHGSIAIVAGYTNSTDLEQALNTHAGGGTDAFLSVLDLSTHQVLKTVYVGGQGEELVGALTSFGLMNPPYVALVGSTTSDDFPGAGPSKGMTDVFVTVFYAGPNPVGDIPHVGAMRLGGSREENGLSMAWAGPAFPQDFYVGGWTDSPDFPLVGALDTVLEPRGRDGFVAKFSLQGFSLEAQPAWSTFVGGSGTDSVRALSFSSQERLILGGLTSSFELPGGTPGFDSTLSQSGDILLASLDLSIGWQPSDGGTQDGGEPWDGGWDGGLPDGSWPEPKPGDGGGPIIKDPDLGLGGGSPLGWSCGCNAFQGVGSMALGGLLALGLLTSRRRRGTGPRSGC